MNLFCNQCLANNNNKLLKQRLNKEDADNKLIGNQCIEFQEVRSMNYWMFKVLTI